MKIGIFTPFPITRNMGAAKMRVELYEQLQLLGNETILIGRQDIGAGKLRSGDHTVNYNKYLKAYLIRESPNFDAVIIEADTLPYKRELFSPRCLIIAWPSLVWAHFQLVKVPSAKRPWIISRLGALKQRIERGLWPGEEMLKLMHLQVATCNSADLIFALTSWDKDTLRAAGVRHTPIEVLPNAISRERLNSLSRGRMARRHGERITLGFVGSYDYRKGALDMPVLMEKLIALGYNVRLKLIGAKGLFVQEESIYEQFPVSIKSRVDVIMLYENAKLGDILADVDVGIFLSYVEGFPFGCLELLAAGVPTVAYSSPGAEEFVPGALLACRGDVDGVVNIISKLIDSPDYRQEIAGQCAQVAKTYEWEVVAAAGNRYIKKYTKCEVE